MTTPTRYMEECLMDALFGTPMPQPAQLKIITSHSPVAMGVPGSIHIVVSIADKNGKDMTIVAEIDVIAGNSVTVLGLPATLQWKISHDR